MNANDALTAKLLGVALTEEFYLRLCSVDLFFGNCLLPGALRRLSLGNKTTWLTEGEEHHSLGSNLAFVASGNED